MRAYSDQRLRDLGLTFSAPAPGDAGYDLYATEAAAIAPGERALIPTGITLEIPPGYVGLVKDRSSMALAGLHTMGGVIDAAYRGEVKVILLNTTREAYAVTAGQKIAQIVILPCYVEAVEGVESAADLSDTTRGAGGFGSTGR